MDKIVDKSLKKVPTIEVSDAKVWYGDFMAIKGIDMSIKRNTVTAFIGPSGCGKSTFLRLLNSKGKLKLTAGIFIKIKCW